MDGMDMVSEGRHGLGIVKVKLGNKNGHLVSRLLPRYIIGQQ